ncbi:unnamed protein product [Rotaria sp. Silwood1]|nr:unnamed protein product [Rotaria sp. Silwood1]CAF1535363.1 unnamed protein product [Rotaria sp. Silwood1]CAF1536056.1 unnamed protein product [Rotaria sp. Silwood1]CAF3627138.1 unnamed protein product [Rotaria sp. Silwood1]CAF3654929.1 unnamed protein product [Rotaria sp. Silwood1]
MDDRLTGNVFSLKNNDFYEFIEALVGQQMVDILKFQSITSTQSLIRNPNIFEIFNMNCSESSFLMIRERSCFQLDNGTFIVKIGLINNLNCLLEFLKQQQQKQIKTSSNEYSNSSLSFDFINKYPLLKKLIIWYQRVDNENEGDQNNNTFLKHFIDTITDNLTKSSNNFRYSDSVKNFALSLYILGGKLTYEFIRLNLPGSLPHLSLLNSLISSSDSRISEGEFRFDQIQKHFDRLNVKYAFGSEDCTGIVKRIKYDSITDTFTGFPSLLDRGVPIKSYYQTDSFDTLKLWFNSIDNASLLNVHMIQPVQSTDNSSISSPYLLSAYGIDNTATANDILQRWWYIFNQSLQRNIRIIGFSTDADPKYLRAMRLMSGFLGALPNFQVHQHPQAFQIKIRSHWSWFYLREQQLLLFFQDPTHLVTKWRNRLLSATAELCLGNQSISINHLHDIIENDTYSKLDHGLTKSDINPKDRQNFSSCFKLTSNDLFNILNDAADTRGTLLYLRMLKMIIVAYIEKTTTIVERLRSAWCVVFFCRLWFTWIKFKTFNLTQTRKNNKSRYFITQAAYLSVEINAHNLLYLILLVKQKHLPPQALHIHIFNSQACESIFRNTRALSGIYSTIVNFTVHDFLRRAQRLSLLNDIKCKQLHNGSVDKLVFPIHYKHRIERQSSFTHSQREIDEIDIEQVIVDAYHQAIDMLEGLDILNLLEKNHVLELKPLSEYLFRQLNSDSQKHNYSSQICNLDDEVFESDDDNDEDETTNDLNMSEDDDDSSVNNDYIDEDEQNNPRDLINTRKKDFSGVKLVDKVQPHIEHTYFKVKLNHDTKFLHKQTACWLLIEDKSKLSNDRLLRVQQVNK